MILPLVGFITLDGASPVFMWSRWRERLFFKGRCEKSELMHVAPVIHVV